MEEKKHDQEILDTEQKVNKIKKRVNKQKAGSKASASEIINRFVDTSF